MSDDKPIRTWIVMPSKGTQPYNVEAHSIEFEENGALTFWLEYVEDRKAYKIAPEVPEYRAVLAMAIAAGMWASAKELIIKPS